MANKSIILTRLTKKDNRHDFHPYQKEIKPRFEVGFQELLNRYSRKLALNGNSISLIENSNFLLSQQQFSILKLHSIKFKNFHHQSA
jgi:hypothetical protein